jgi:hypothetical protein
VLAIFTNNPHTSTRCVASLEEMPSQTTIRRILKEMKFHPYKLKIHHMLRPQDHQKRIEHAQAQLNLITCSQFLKNVIFSDEAHFHVHGSVNHQNFRYWSEENPNWFREEPLHSPRVTVWAAIGCQAVIGPVFIEGNVTGASYLTLLQQQLFPALEQLANFDSIIFMQDGAPPHWSLSVRNWLAASFPERWMGRGSPNLPWPPYSPDLTPCDFFLWGWIKSRVYREPVADVGELRQRIEEAFMELSPFTVEAAINSYEGRLRRCIEVGGQSVE